MEYAARIAPEVDRLVLAVNRTASSQSGDTEKVMAERLGLDSPALLKHYAEFLLSGALTVDLAVMRLPYQSPALIRDRVARWRNLGLVTGPDDALGATDALRPLLATILEARERVATDLWSNSDFFDSADELVRKVTLGVPDRFLLATAHRSLPDPASPFLGLHHRLTTIRYARAQSHTAAWRRENLDPDEIGVLTVLWHAGGTSDATVPRGLVVRELASADGGGLTVSGMRLRQAIEDETNRDAAAIFAHLDEDDRENLIVALARLPGEPT